MIWDCIFYNGESDLLEARVEHLAGVVDRHVIVEGTRTFSGEWRQVFRPPVAGAHHHVVPLPAGEARGAWPRERQQRDGCVSALRAAGAKPEDMVLLADVDEFPRREVLTPGEPRGLELQSLLYYLNGWQDGGVGLCSVLAPFGYIEKMTGSVARNERYRMPVIHDAGWHFTYQGGADAIRRKLAAFSHQELNTEAMTAPGEIERRMDTGLWLAADAPTVRYVPLESFAPPAIQNLATRRPGMVHG